MTTSPWTSWISLVHKGMLIGGVTGVGKSTMVDAVGRVLSAGVGTVAVVDTDTLAQFGPPPRDGSPTERQWFYDDLKCRNLAAVWANFEAAGARFAVVSGGIDSAELRARYTGALAGCEVQMVRLVAPTETVRERLRGRDDGAKLDRGLGVLAEQEALLDSLHVEDFTVVNDRPLVDVAREIVTRAGWLV